MRTAVSVEWLKMRRSRVTLVATALMSLLLPAMGLGFYSAATSGSSGALAEQARALLIGEGWVAYLRLVDQVSAAALFFGAGVVVAWVFGREHADRTFASLFALPVSRRAIAGAKFAVLVAWIVALSTVVCLVALVLGLVGGVGLVDIGVVVPELARLLAIIVGTGILSLTMGYVASLGRGYLPAVAALVVIIALAQVAVLFGTGGWFPFAVPGLMAVSGAEGVPELNGMQFALVPAIAAVGVWLTTRWWDKTGVV